ncbi:hypothetical protein HNR39_004536 [Glaciimonas immobilis]|uniref:Uncharacterized protein n=1 Tax=Glaciimonas immobilis TaxID=728004 RepID=A0A840S0R2_9BURK|nr:hypothetical protein [Glaciimonas immobilis]
MGKRLGIDYREETIQTDVLSRSQINASPELNRSYYSETTLENIPYQA